MEKTTTSSHHHPVLSQNRSNATIWVGHLPADPHDHLAGQTFLAPTSGVLDNIQVHMNAVQQPGRVILSLHPFDPAAQVWGPAMAESMLEVASADHGNWIRFALADVRLDAGSGYGFRLFSPDAMVGIGEGVSGNTDPFAGREWNAEAPDQAGRFFSYFSLAFRVEMRD